MTLGEKIHLAYRIICERDQYVDRCQASVRGKVFLTKTVEAELGEDAAIDEDIATIIPVAAMADHLIERLEAHGVYREQYSIETWERHETEKEEYPIAIWQITLHFFKEAEQKRRKTTPKRKRVKKAS